MSSPYLLCALFGEEIIKLENATQALTENNRQYLSTFSEEISLGLHHTVKKDTYFFSAYYTYITQLQKTLEQTDRCILKISDIIQQADQTIQIEIIEKCNNILCSYRSFRQGISSLLEETQLLIADTEDTVSGSKLFRCVQNFQYQLQHFSSILSEYAIK